MADTQDISLAIPDEQQHPNHTQKSGLINQNRTIDRTSTAYKQKNRVQHKESVKKKIAFLMIGGIILLIVIIGLYFILIDRNNNLTSESLPHLNQHSALRAEQRKKLKLKQSNLTQTQGSNQQNSQDSQRFYKNKEGIVLQTKVKQISKKMNEFQIDEKDHDLKIEMLQMKINQELEQNKNVLQKIKTVQASVQKRNEVFEQNMKHLHEMQQKTLKYEKILKQLQTEEPKQKQGIKFNVPKYVWIYKDNHKVQKIDQYKAENRKYWIQKSNYQLRQFSQNNTQKWLKNTTQEMLKSLLQQLKQKVESNPQMKIHWNAIKKTILKLTLLKQIGGVFVDNDYILVESLDWIQDIKQNIHVNTGNSYGKPTIFGFYSYLASTPQKKQNKQFVVEVDKYMIISPALREYFLATIPQNQYLKQVFDQYVSFIRNPDSIQTIVKQNNIEVRNLLKVKFQELFTLTTTVVCQLKQKQLNGQKQLYQGKFDKFAVDELGIFSMNSFYFPQKMKFFFPDDRISKDFNYLGKMPQQQFQQSIGLFRYIAMPDAYPDLRQKIKRGLRKQADSPIIENSFLHNHLLLKKKYDFVIQNKQKTFKLTSFQKWTNLPKILWLFWANGIDNAPAGNQLCVFNLKRNAQAAGFVVNIVSQQNAKDHISNQSLIKINAAITNAKMEIKLQTKSDLYRLALLSAHGGIYLDASYIFVQDFSWIINIAGQHSSHIFNRYGTLPKILMQFHPMFGGLFDWQIDEKANTKTQWHLALQSNFVAVQKDNEYIKEWFDMLIFFITNTYETTFDKMVECRIQKDRWSWTKGFRYLAVMDALKVVLGCRQKQIQKDLRQNINTYANAMDYYKLWSINGYTGIQKYRRYTNFANHHSLQGNLQNDDNIFLTQFSEQYVDQLLGKPYKTIKMYNAGTAFLNQFLTKNYENMNREAHPQSILQKYVYISTEHSLFASDKVHAKLKSNESK